MRSKKSSRWFALALFAGLAIGTPVYAHHSFAAEYDINQRLTLTGTLTKFEWTNPHAWLRVDVKDASGKVTNWAVEFGAPNALYRRGFRKDDFPAGIVVVIDGYRARNGTPTINGRSVKLPDGRNFFAASSAPDAPQ